MLQVWVDDKPVGRIGRFGPSGRGMTFRYDDGVDPSLAVSLTMPPRLASFDANVGLLPVFDANLPEGALRHRIHASLAKQVGTVTDLDILTLTGGNQIGRIRVLPDGATPRRRDPIGTISGLLTQKVTPEFIEDIMNRYALGSGVAGVVPKVLAEESVRDMDPKDIRVTAQTRDWILKFGDGEYPGLPIVEHYCMEVLRRAGIPAAETHLSQDGHMLAVRRFDEFDGRRIAFEDFTSLNGKTSRDKYDASIETGLFKRMAEFSSADARLENLRQVFSVTAANILLRNGDAHLKNFGMIYENTNGSVRVSPAFDIVSTCTWLKNDTMALSLNGSRNWPEKKHILSLAARARLGQMEAEEIIDNICTAMVSVASEVQDALQGADLQDQSESLMKSWSIGLMSIGRNLFPQKSHGLSQ